MTRKITIMAIMLNLDHFRVEDNNSVDVTESTEVQVEGNTDSRQAPESVREIMCITWSPFHYPTDKININLSAS